MGFKGCPTGKHLPSQRNEGPGPGLGEADTEALGFWNVTPLILKGPFLFPSNPTSHPVGLDAAVSVVRDRAGAEPSGLPRKQIMCASARRLSSPQKNPLSWGAW